MAKTYYGADAVKQMEKQMGRKLSYLEKRIVEEEGYVTGDYKDTKGIVTGGVGQTGKYKDKPFEYAFNDHLKRAKKLIHAFDRFPEDVQAELLQGVYRGDVGGSPTFRKLLNAGDYAGAAQAYLDNKEYKDKKTPPAIKARMERVASAVAGLNKPKQPEPVVQTTAQPTEPLGYSLPDTNPYEFPGFLDQATLENEFFSRKTSI